MFELKKSDLIQKFQLQMPVHYHSGATRRVSHLTNKPLRKASVLIPFVERDKGIHVVLTKRAEHLKHHPGQISFPGGKVEEFDRSIICTAIREADEEIGIKPRQVSVFGRMPELITVSQFAVTPVLAFINSNYQAQIDRNEVDEVFEVPLNVLLDKSNLHSHTFKIAKQTHRVFGLPYKHYFIWGMTAQIIQAMQAHIMEV